MYQPLADEFRPKDLSDIVGQSHILGENSLLRRIVATGQIPNMIFYGPSGTGKTTLARIIAEKTNRSLRRLNATTAGIADIKAIIDELDTFLVPNGILLYLDEIQYFNKKQQQSLLEFIENGKITLIASTTENPYFYVFNAILSRSTIFEFKQISPEDVETALNRGIKLLKQRDLVEIEIEDGVLEKISQGCGGDVRKALNALELIYNASKTASSKVHISLDDSQTVTQKSAMKYDKDGEAHYDSLSALHKSMRGSDPDAALYYLGRLLVAGDLIGASRRILCCVSEDVGLAHPQAALICKALVDTAFQLGLPEGRIPLAQAVVLIATSPKSNSSYMGINAAMADIEHGMVYDIPRELQNVHADSTELKREQGYKYPHDYANHYVNQAYLPKELKGKKYYEYGENKIEQAAKNYWELIK